MISGLAKRYLRDNDRFPGFTPGATVVGVFGERMPRIIVLGRREKDFARSGNVRIAIRRRRSPEADRRGPGFTVVAPEKANRLP
jgi:hypothetical protein